MHDISKQIEDLELQILSELENLKKQVLKPVNNDAIHLKMLQKRLNYLQWGNKKLSLYSAQQPKVVKQREIFYCELGQNIGSEQDGRRPVVIIQNNIGNAHAKITLIAPITSFRKGSIIKENGKLFLKEMKNGKSIKRILRFYDIPLELEEDSKYPIYGVVNVSQLRVVSKNRLSMTPVAKITEQNYAQIVDAITKNISVFEDRT